MTRVPAAGSVAITLAEISFGQQWNLTGVSQPQFIIESVRKTLLFVLACNILLGVSTVKGQSDQKKFELGAQFTYLKLAGIRTPTASAPCFDNLSGCTVATSSDNGDLPGFGGRLGYNLNRSVGVEAEVNFFPEKDLHRRKVQGLFGVKAGKRLENIGLFAKIRPGFIHFTRGSFSPNGLCDAIFSGCFSATGLTNFALDLGGIVEVYTSKRTFIRLDVGDTVIRHGRRNQLGTLIAPNGLTSVVIPVKVSTKHNLQTSVGIGFRF